MNIEEIIETFRVAIPKARQEVYDVAEMFASNEASPPTRWNTYKPFFELVYYLAWLDYILKVQVLNLIDDPDNRLVGESALGLTLYEMVEKLPRAASRAYACIQEKPSRAPISLDSYRNAQEAYKQALKEVNANKELQDSLRLIRNGVAAHHGFDKGKGAEHLVAWAIANAQAVNADLPVTESAVFTGAVDIGRAVQEFGYQLRIAVSQ